MKRLVGIALITLFFVIALASLPSDSGMRLTPAAHAGHTGIGGIYCDGFRMADGTCSSCGMPYGGLVYRRDQGEDGEIKVAEIDLPGRLALAVIRLVLLHRF